MTLHEAIEQTLKQSGKSMTASEIANEINRTKLYSRADGGPIPSSQIGARVKNYPQWFDKTGSYISNKKFSPSKGAAVSNNLKSISNNIPKGNFIQSKPLAIKVLLNQGNHKSAAIIGGVVPKEAGVYSLRIKDPSILPASFSNELSERKHNLIYIGIASRSLYKRLAQELQAKGHGTFFRSIGATLGFLPEKGSLNNKKNKRNFTFSASDEIQIKEWIYENILVNWINMNEGIEEFETQLILEYKPLLNIAKNPVALSELKGLRAKCVEIANQPS
jgi:hypothetical protein